MYSKRTRGFIFNVSGKRAAQKRASGGFQMAIRVIYFFSVEGRTSSSTCFLYSAKSMGEQMNSGIS